jgi:photosystem II CP47 chlorophyll apoprotein
MGNIETILSSSIIVCGFAALVNAAILWYGGVISPIDLFGPTRYQWDNSFYSQELERRVKTTSNSSWNEINDKLVLYDYIGSNPAKGGIFRAGPIIKGDGLAQNWVGHPYFKLGKVALFVRRIPPFFETFPVLIIDQRGRLRADIPFRRASANYSIEQAKGMVVTFSGGILDQRSYTRATLLKGYALKSQYGEIFTFDKKSVGSDGVYRTSPRGWYSFSHVCLAILFFFGHLWHGGRALFKDLSAGITVEGVVAEYGVNEKLGENSSRTTRVL